MRDGRNNKNNAKSFVEFGDKLRLAREALGLHITEVANQLLVNKQRIIEIENGDYSNITSQLHLRWYLNSYAKIVGLSEYEIPNLLNEFVNDSDLRIDEIIIVGAKKRFNEGDGEKNSGFYKILFLSLALVMVLYIPNKERDNEQIRHLVNYLIERYK